jgi:hypothetical protein
MIILDPTQTKPELSNGFGSSLSSVYVDMNVSAKKQSHLVILYFMIIWICSVNELELGMYRDRDQTETLGLGQSRS